MGRKTPFWNIKISNPLIMIIDQSIEVYKYVFNIIITTLMV